MQGYTVDLYSEKRAKPGGTQIWSQDSWGPKAGRPQLKPDLGVT